VGEVRKHSQLFLGSPNEIFKDYFLGSSCRCCLGSPFPFSIPSMNQLTQQSARTGGRNVAPESSGACSQAVEFERPGAASGHDLRRARPVPQPLLYDGGRPGANRTQATNDCCRQIPTSRCNIFRTHLARRPPRLSACVHTLSSNFHPLEVGTLSLIDGLAIDFLAGQPSRDDSYHFHLPPYLSCPSFLDL
jgi:hypothetical protein